jgi:hypothetical protein
MTPSNPVDSHFLMLVASARTGGNAETLARRAAAALARDTRQTWLRLASFPLPLFEDRRHVGDGNRPNDVLQDAESLALAGTFFSSRAARLRVRDDAAALNAMRAVRGPLCRERSFGPGIVRVRLLSTI